MFTGIVEEVGRVKALGPASDGSRKFAITATTVLEGLIPGDSIAVNGACLTVIELDEGSFSVDLAPETLRRTNLGDLAQDDVVNLERPLSLADRLGGHIVQGHADGTGRVSSMRPEGDCVIMGFRVPRGLMRYVVEKGFIAIDGMSLTVVKRGTSSFTVSVIPYTLEHTNLRGRRKGDRVNLEVDIVAKYVENLVRL